MDTFYCMTGRMKPLVIVFGWLLAVAVFAAQDTPEVKPEVKPEEKPDVKPEAKPATSDTKLEVKGEIKPEPKPELNEPEEPAKPEKPAGPIVTVTEKNPFRLRLPLAPRTNAVVDRVSLNLRLTGITGFSNVKKALIVMTVPGTTRADSFILAEGEQQGVLEIVKIDENEGTVLVKNAGETQKLFFPSESPTASSPASSRSSGSSRSSSGSLFNPFSRSSKTGRDGDRERERGSPEQPGTPLRSIPTRQSPSVPQTGVITREPLRFDLAVQTTAIDARGIGTLRETPRGQISSVPPTDLLPETK